MNKIKGLDIFCLIVELISIVFGVAAILISFEFKPLVDLEYEIMTKNELTNFNHYKNKATYVITNDKSLNSFVNEVKKISKL